LLLLLRGLLFVLEVCPQSHAHIGVAKDQDQKGDEEVAQRIPSHIGLNKENHESQAEKHFLQTKMANKSSEFVTNHIETKRQLFVTT